MPNEKEGGRELEKKQKAREAEKKKQKFDKSKVLKGRSIQGVASSKLVLQTMDYSPLRYLQMNVLPWEHVKILLVCWEKKGSSALTQMPVDALQLPLYG